MNSKDIRLWVDSGKAAFPVAPDFYGIFFEDINHGGDGGLHAEYVRNRFFEDAVVPVRCTLSRPGILRSPTGWEQPFDDSTPLPGWRLELSGDGAAWTLDRSTSPSPARPVSLRIDAENGTRLRLANHGWSGIPAARSRSWRLSLIIKAENPDLVTLKARIVADNGYPDHDLAWIENLEQARTIPLAQGWMQLNLDCPGTVALEDPAMTGPLGSLVLEMESTGSLWIGMVSLFPSDTFKNRDNGLRKDLSDLIAGLKPRFLRFPGGCIVEGFSLETMWRWKKTIGPIHERDGHWLLWHYRTTNGLGWHEGLQFAEDLGVPMMLVVNCGMTCQGRKPEYVNPQFLDEFIQDALDALEYALGPADSTWGALRARAGHPAPFDVQWVEIGNENYGPEYEASYRRFHEALSREYPALKLISNCHTEKSGLPTRIVDEHFYADCDFFLSNHDWYDSYDRKGPKIYVGEFSEFLLSQKGCLKGTLAEAAFLTGLERNQDLVSMVSYAPLLCHQDWINWGPDAIWFDAQSAWGSPSYHLLSLFARHRGDMQVPLLTDASSSKQIKQGKAGLHAPWLQASMAVMEINQEATLFMPEPTGEALLSKSPDFTNGEVKVFLPDIINTDRIGIYFHHNGQTSSQQDWCRWEISEGQSCLVHQIGWSRETLAPSVPVGSLAGEILTLILDEDGFECRIGTILVHKGRRKPLPDIFVTAALDHVRKQMILKLVNPWDAGRSLVLDLPLGNGPGEAWTITGEPHDTNTAARMQLISPQHTTLPPLGPGKRHTLPGHSIQVLRLPFPSQKDQSQ